jgi:Xaa-Pro aminopeptidase
VDHQEHTIKRERLLTLMQQHNVDALWLAQSANVAWLSGGNRVYIDTSAEQGVASVLVTPDQAYLITNNIEADRLKQEEGFAEWEVVADPWYKPGAALQSLTAGQRVAADHANPEFLNVSEDLIDLRAPLTAPEIERYRALGHEAGRALEQAARKLTPGMTEHQAAGLIAEATFAIGAVPIVILVAADARMQSIRHPLPTDKRIERVVMLVLCARKQGLIANLTRIVHFGAVPPELRRRMEAIAQIDATAIAATRPGVAVAQIFDTIRQAYAAAGFADEWQHHHQGGACSYGSRDYIATPDSDATVKAPQAFAWNPSVPGAKSEDTILVSDAGVEILTPSPGWPTLTFEIDGQQIVRPDILEI